MGIHFYRLPFKQFFSVQYEYIHTFKDSYTSISPVNNGIMLVFVFFIQLVNVILFINLKIVTSLIQ